MRPILFSLGPFDFFVSPIFAGFSAILAYAYFGRNADYARLNEKEFWNLMLWLAVGTVLGGFALYFFLYGGGVQGNIRYIMKYHSLRGGAFYGNLIGAVLAAWGYARWRQASFPRIADLIAGSAPLALSLMRWGCLMQGCCHGTPSQSALAIVFTDRRAAMSKSLLGVPLHPAQIYESIGALAIFLIVHFHFLRGVRAERYRPGTPFAASVILYGVLRFLMEFIRGKDAGVFQPAGLTTSQVLALLTAAWAVIAYRQWRAAK